jgi:Fur family ferric uptake transcriptional regulator
MTEVTSPLTSEQARVLIRDAGLRSTPSRLAVIRHLSAALQPLSHAEVAEALVPAGHEKSTLYRCLVELADVGILSRMDAGDHSWRFEMRREEQGGEHPHFVCVDCGKITCLPEVEVNIAPSRAAKGKMGEVTEVVLKGHCKECK